MALLSRTFSRDLLRTLIVSSASAALNLLFSALLFDERWVVSFIEGGKWLEEAVGWANDSQKIRKMYELWPPYGHLGFYFFFALLSLYYVRYRSLSSDAPSTSAITARLFAVSGALFAILFLPMRLGEFHLFVLGLNLLHVLVAPQTVLFVAKTVALVERCFSAALLSKTKEE
ncbi:hypothetical protein QR680_012954 [Steinernema hermaphroditum]|uniref:Uncharacterized protein n=1 Tax=Steinernema hermaphroditum TaxID=289476 RepID=A0AA39I675_9BILA|nr:hypothetical protein QR680_012954 [Steinernema hermaphroditum]